MKRVAVCMAILLLAVCPMAAAAETRADGDIDADGTVSAADAAIVLRAADGLMSLDAGSSALADTTGDMLVGRADATAILLLCTERIGAFSELRTGGADTLLQGRFLGRFSYQGAVSRRKGYRSGEVSVSISSFAYAGAVCYLADVYVQHVDSLRTEFGGGAYSAGREPAADMAARVGALLAVNGDQYSGISGGPLVRNGVWYRDTVERDCDVCVLYRSGVMETFAAGTADVKTLREAGVYQSWVCGPRLLDENGAAMESFTCPLNVKNRAARTAIGYYEPGHYCLLAVDGTRNADSEGILLEDMSRLFSELGCKAAYNLSGGASTLMCTAADVVSTPYSQLRTVSDIFYITEPDA